MSKWSLESWKSFVVTQPPGWIDDIRLKEKLKQFDKIFIKLARDVYKSNDIRSLIKKKLI